MNEKGLASYFDFSTVNWPNMWAATWETIWMTVDSRSEEHTSELQSRE